MISNQNYSRKFKEKISKKEERTVRNGRIRSIGNMRQNRMIQNKNCKTRILHILKIPYGHIGEILTLSGIFLPDGEECVNRIIRIVCLLVRIIVEIIFSLTQESK